VFSQVLLAAPHTGGQKVLDRAFGNPEPPRDLLLRDVLEFAENDDFTVAGGEGDDSIDYLQPIVAANLKARGLADTIDLLASQRRIYPEDALKMKLFVKGAERDSPQGYKEVATGLTVQGGYLAWGPFKLAAVPPIQWP
jgi:hypothetical protein